MVKKQSSNKARQKRHERIRQHLSGTPERPRLNVYRGLKNIYAQIIDDTTGNTLVSASSLEKELGLSYGGNCEAAKVVGGAIAKRALEKGIKTVVFDRGGYLYHGRVAELAQAARDGGLEF